MTPARYQLVKRIFLDVCASEPGARAAVLERACGKDPELRTEVESLLAQDERDEEFLETPVVDPVNMWSAMEAAKRDGRAERGLPRRIGNYRIISVLGEGGMGIVYLAEQDNPKRQVALKIIRAGAAGAQTLRRFDFEAQLLARLHHPGIAQIYEAGVADTGAGVQPYFALELVRGKPLREFLAAHRLTLNEKLELMARICDAVHHAHQKGVIHRDLKPANILVEEGTEAPRHGGTKGEIDDLRLTSDESGTVDSRADIPRSSIVNRQSSIPPVHAPAPKILDFGVARAVDAEALRTTLRTFAGQLVGTVLYMSPEQAGGNADDLDTRSDVYSLGVILYEMLAQRHPLPLENQSLAEAARLIRDEPITPLASVEPSLRGDVATIVHKALEKERERRYQSASELAEDLRRFIRHEPIAARPRSWAYSARLLARRHPAGIAAISLAVVLVLLTPILWANANAAQALASQVQSRASELQQHALETPQGSDPFEPRETDLARLQDHIAFIEQHLDDEPLEAAKIRNLVGLNYWRMGKYPEALTQIEIGLTLRKGELKPPHADLAESLHDMGRVLWHLQRLDEAEQHYGAALAMRLTLFGEKDPESATSMMHLAATLYKQGKHDQAEKLFRRVLDIRLQLGNQEDIAASYNNLAICLRDMGQYGEACDLSRKALEIISASAQPGDLRIAKAMQNAASCLIDLGQLLEAETLLAEALHIKTKKLPSSHPDIATALYQQARLRWAQQDQAEAERLCREALKSQIEAAPSHTDAADTMTLLGVILTARGDVAEAEDLLRRALTIRRSRLPHDHWQIGEALSALGANLLLQERYDEAGPFLRNGYEMLRWRGENDPLTRAAAERLAAFEKRETAMSPDR